MTPEHRAAWRGLYDHYLFQADGDPMEPLIIAHRETRKPVDSTAIARLRQLLGELLGR